MRKIFLKADLSLAEPRVVYTYTHDPELLRLARMAPWEYDCHRDNASIVFGLPQDQITGSQRHSGKRIVNGSHYLMLPERMSDTLLKDGFVYTPQECEVFQERYLGKRLGIGRWQRSIKLELIKNRKLTNSWGWTIEFLFERLDSALHRRGLAFKPQSDIGILLNQCGLIPLHGFIERNGLESRINLQQHDELVVSVTKAEVWDVARFLKESLEVERLYEGEKLTVPVVFSFGTSWDAELEFKKFPEMQDELMESGVGRLFDEGD